MKSKIFFLGFLISLLFVTAVGTAQNKMATNLSKVGGLKLPDFAYGLFATSSHVNRDSTFADFVNYSAKFSLWVGAVTSKGDSLVTAGTGNSSTRRPEWAPIHPSFAVNSNSGLQGVNKISCLSFSDGVVFAKHTPLGLYVQQKAYEFPNSGYAIIDYAISLDRKTSLLKNVYIGLWADIDTPDNNNRVTPYDDIIGFAQNNLAVYVYNSAAKNKKGARLGVKILSAKTPIVSWWQNSDDPIRDNSQYSYLSGKAPNTKPDKPGDWRFLLSDGPYSLDTGDTLQFTIAIVQAPDAAKFENSLSQADAFFSQNLKAASLRKGLRTANPATIAYGTTPVEFHLYPNYPNPFNPETQIRFDLPEATHVSLKIYNSAGQIVRTLIDRAFQAGAFSVKWNARDDEGRLLPSGVYFYQIRAGSFQAQRKLLLLK